MALALVLLSLLHALGLVASFFFGWAMSHAMVSAEAHLYVSLSSVVLALFTHSMILFYFIGTGKTLKEVIARESLGPEYGRRIRWFKVQTSGPLTLACAAVITASMLGGRILAGGSAEAHFWAGAVAAVLNVWVVLREIRCIALNVELFHEIGEKVGPLEPQDAPAPSN